jgi:hypothetical protein
MHSGTATEEEGFDLPALSVSEMRNLHHFSKILKSTAFYFWADPAATYNNIEGWLRFDPVNFIKWYVLDYRSRPQSVHTTIAQRSVWITNSNKYQSILKKGITNRRSIHNLLTLSAIVAPQPRTAP